MHDANPPQTAARVATLAATLGLALSALIALGPLELRDTLPLGPISLSTTELIAAVAALTGAWATWRRWQLDPLGSWVPRGRAAWWPLAVLALWAGVHMLSVAWAPADRGHVVKFSLRLAGEVSLAGLAYLWADQPRFRERIVGAVVAGLAIITVLAVAERGLGRGFEFALLQFRDEPTWMLGEQRLSTVFYHANTCAAYLELTSPLLLVLACTPGRRPWSRVLLLVWAALLAVLLSLTYSRAGLLAGVFGGVVLAVAGRQLSPRRLWVAVPVLWSLLVVTAYAANPDMRARIGLDERSYRPEYKFLAGCVGRPGHVVRVPLRIRNRGTWDLANRQAPAHLIHTWMTPRGLQLADSWDYTPLPDLPAGATVVVDVPLTLPGRPGRYVVAADILRDRVLRISGVGAPLALLACAVVAEGEALPVADSRPPDAAAFHSVRAWRGLDLERRHYWRAALLLWVRRPLLGWGADRFALIHREYVPAQGYDPRARAHSVVFETAVDLGLLGVAVLMVLLASVFRAGRLAFRRGWQSDRGMALAVTAGICALGLHSTVDYFLIYTQIAVVLWPLVGMLLGSQRFAPAPQGSAEAAAGNSP